MRERTIKLKVVKINLEKEQSVRIHTQNFDMLIYKNYPQSKDPHMMRLHQRRINKGMCTVHGCFLKPVKNRQKCRFHLELDRMRHRK